MKLQFVSGLLQTFACYFKLQLAGLHAANN